MTPAARRDVDSASLLPDSRYLPHHVEIDVATLGVGHTITVPAPLPGQRTLVILNGIVEPNAGEPGLGDDGISLVDEDLTGGSNVELVDAMPKPNDPDDPLFMNTWPWTVGQPSIGAP